MELEEKQSMFKYEKSRIGPSHSNFLKRGKKEEWASGTGILNINRSGREFVERRWHRRLLTLPPMKLSRSVLPARHGANCP